LRSRDWLPPDLRGRVKQLRQRLEDARQLGRVAPTTEELAEAFGCVSGDLDRLLAISRSGQRKNNRELMSAESAALSARLGVRAPRTPYEETEFCDQKRLLAEAIEKLPERERQVVLLRYHEDLLLHEIGKVLDVTESRACQIHTEALRRLKRALSRAGLGVNL
jgi:RNA polymerase sigma factor for flagellar operon FliA